jgi:hypothetical protein
MIEFATCSPCRLTYTEALIYCQFLEYNGHTNWRLPTYDDLDVWAHTYNEEYHGWVNNDTLKRISVLHFFVLPVRDV